MSSAYASNIAFFHGAMRIRGRIRVKLNAGTCSGVLPSMRRASAREVRSTSGLMSSASAALVSSHSRRVSSRTNFSSNIFRSCNVGVQGFTTRV